MLQSWNTKYNARGSGHPGILTEDESKAVKQHNGLREECADVDWAFLGLVSACLGTGCNQKNQWKDTGSSASRRELLGGCRQKSPRLV